MKRHIRHFGKLAWKWHFLRVIYLRLFCHVPYKIFSKHVYVTGSTGSGKTELLKFLVHQVIRNQNKWHVPRSIVIIEPDWEMSRELVRHKNFPKGKVLYFSTVADPRRAEEGKELPSYNLFDFPHDGEEAIDHYAQSLSNAFQELMWDFSPNMELITKSCFHVLLRAKNATLQDFLKLLDDEQNEKLLDQAKRNPVDSVRNFFLHSFHQSNYEATRRSLTARVSNMLMNTTFARVVSSSQSSFDLEEIANTGGVALFSMEWLWDDGGKALWRLLIARLRQIAFSRPAPKHVRPETLVIVDEFQEYVWKSIEKILTQGRKFRIWLVLASQFVGQGMDTETKKAVLSCTNTKIAGVNDAENFKALKNHLGITLEQFEKLKTGLFFFRSSILKKRRCLNPFKKPVNERETKSHIIHAPTWFLDNKGQISAKEWKEFLRRQRTRFYKWGGQENNIYQKTSSKEDTAQKPKNFQYHWF